MKEMLDAQQQHWEKTFSRTADMFGKQPSDPVRIAVEIFKKEGKLRLLELGGGQGRDTQYFARHGFNVDVLDYSKEAITAITEKMRQLGFSQAVTARQHDVRHPLPFDDDTFDACYSHMLYCMPLTQSELGFLSGEVCRVLKPGGLNVYTVRHTGDAHYGTGIHRGEDMYEVGGFIVHFFDMQKVEHLSQGFERISIDEFEEGNLPRKLWRVTLRKK
jgi:SAM-dependent methyltransferase